jgi:hypothetical protein
MIAPERAIDTLGRVTDRIEAVLAALDRHVVCGTNPAADEVRRHVDRLVTALDFAEDLRCELAEPPRQTSRQPSTGRDSGGLVADPCPREGATP